jgi:hypothetical protein
MIKIENTEVMGWEAAIRGMRNPMNSWEKSDSNYRPILASRCDTCMSYRFDNWDDCDDCEVHKLCNSPNYFLVGPNDLDLMTRLSKAGTDHRKFMRMITVYLDITAPLYWWKEFDTYKVGTVANSCSTMHKIADKEFEPSDFSYEHLDDIWGYEPEVRDMAPVVELETHTDKITNYILGPDDILNLTIKMLNRCRDLYLITGENLKKNDLTETERKDLMAQQKVYWWQMIQLLPSSYNQRRTVMLNYEVLANIYKSRKGHKLDEWNSFCDWIESLPYAELITGKEK